MKSEDEFDVLLTRVSFICGEFTMQFKVLKKDNPNHAQLSAHGTGIGSTIDLETFMDLSNSLSERTIMKWSANTRIGGRIASVGQRLLFGQAEKKSSNCSIA